MKIKTSFITNSSSSTFIVAWPMKINTIENVKEFISHKYAKTIFNDAYGTKPILKNDKGAIKKLAYEFTPASFIHGNEYKDIQNEFCKSEGITHKELHKNHHWYFQFLEHFHWKEEEVAYENAKKFLDEIPEESYIYIFSYSDEDGEYFAEIEHGDVFHKLKHIKISCH